MTKRTAVAVSVVSVLVALASVGASLFLLSRPPVVKTLPAATGFTDQKAHLPDKVEASLVDFDDESSAAETPETDTEPSQPAGPPPPVTVTKMDANRLRRVVFNPPIGEIGRIYYDRSWDLLLMAVVEPDGLQSIWRVDSKLQLSRVLRAQKQPGEIFLAGDSLGRIYANFANEGTLYRSEDLGRSWQLVASDIDGAFWSLADDGAGTLWASLHAYNKALLYRSQDDGYTWEIWKDFHMLYPELAVPYAEGDNRFRLRHLHSVAYQDGSLFVGVGDVARFTVRSDDQGQTWREIWSEGFTASVPVLDQPALLLGPDKLQSHGIAWHDLASGQTREVWSPLPYDYAGYTYSMIRMDDSYYAAFHTETNEVSDFQGHSGIIVSPDGETWYPFLTIDKLTNAARTDMYLAPGRTHSYGHVSINGTLYRFEPPIGRWFEVHQPFSSSE